MEAGGRAGGRQTGSSRHSRGAEVAAAVESLKIFPRSSLGALAIAEDTGTLDETLKKLQAAHLDLEKARAALAAGSPELRVRALADIELSSGGRRLEIA